MQVSITGLLYVIALTLLVVLKPLVRFLLEAIGIVLYVGFIAIGYAVMWVVVDVRARLYRRDRSG